MRSLRGRLIAFSALWTGLALTLAWFFIATLLSDFVSRRFTAELDAVIEAVMAASEWDDTGGFTVTPAPTDPRFDTPLSGWYWQVSYDNGILAKSPSLWTGEIAVGGPAGDVELSDAEGLALFGRMRLYTAPGASFTLRVTVTMPAETREAEIARITQPLAGALIVLGLGLILASLVSVTLGLRVLDRLRADLRDVRTGRRDGLALPKASELRPLAEEINRLIDRNRAVVARARTHVGNLAHALKTPLAALANRPDMPGDGMDLIARMERLIRWHLTGARAAGHVRGLGQRVPVRAVIDDLAMVLAPDISRRALQCRIDCPESLCFAGEREDLEEMLGNLMENATKWAGAVIHVRGEETGQGMLAVTISDDGPGIPEQDREAALGRGIRFDQSVPGTGLGLAIVADLVALHGGDLTLAPAGADGHGLSATLTLPAIAAKGGTT